MKKLIGTILVVNLFSANLLAADVDNDRKIRCGFFISTQHLEKHGGERIYYFSSIFKTRVEEIKNNGSEWEAAFYKLTVGSKDRRKNKSRVRTNYYNDCGFVKQEHKRLTQSLKDTRGVKGIINYPWSP